MKLTKKQKKGNLLVEILRQLNCDDDLNQWWSDHYNAVNLTFKDVRDTLFRYALVKDRDIYATYIIEEMDKFTLFFYDCDYFDDIEYIDYFPNPNTGKFFKNKKEAIEEGANEG